MTSAKQYKKDLERKSIAWKAKNAVRKAINPTPEEMREKTAKIRQQNKVKEERVRALEESRQARVKAQRLREREAAARRPIPVKSSGGKVKAGKVMKVFDNSVYGGSGGGIDFSQFGTINQDPFGASRSSPQTSNSSKKKTNMKASGSTKSRDPYEFFYR